LVPNVIKRFTAHIPVLRNVIGREQVIVRYESIDSDGKMFQRRIQQVPVRRELIDILALGVLAYSLRPYLHGRDYFMLPMVSIFCANMLAPIIVRCALADVPGIRKVFSKSDLMYERGIFHQLGIVQRISSAADAISRGWNAGKYP